MSENETIAALQQKARYDYEDLLAVMCALRSPEGCPWDREQDHHSIRSALIEETYEVIEAIDNDDSVLLREELGDLLFQIVFHAHLEEEKGTFAMGDVIHDISAKMVHRHPHVFGTVEVRDSGEVLQNWENIKTEEKQRNTLYQKLCAIPPMLPALMRASKVAKKAKLTEKTSAEALLSEMQTRLADLQNGIPNAAKEDLHTSLGTLLMQVSTLAGVLGVDLEHALSDETDRVISRFSVENP